jgi:acyl carrier protein
METTLPTQAEIIDEVRSYILRELVSGQRALDASTRLLHTGILDSLSAANLVGFLEQRYQIEVLPHEMDPEHLDTLTAIARLVADKLARRGA